VSGVWWWVDLLRLICQISGTSTVFKTYAPCPYFSSFKNQWLLPCVVESPINTKRDRNLQSNGFLYGSKMRYQAGVCWLVPTQCPSWYPFVQIRESVCSWFPILHFEHIVGCLISLSTITVSTLHIEKHILQPNRPVARFSVPPGSFYRQTIRKIKYLQRFMLGVSVLTWKRCCPSSSYARQLGIAPCSWMTWKCG
jgi:hypothetical protein